MELLDEIATAKLLSVSVAFLRAGRVRGVVGNRTPPPPHFKLGNSVRYARADLEEWLQKRRIDPGARRKGKAA